MPPIPVLIAAVIAAQTPAPAEPAFVPGGTIGVVRPAAAGKRATPEGPAAEAVESALSDAGFTVIPSAQHARHTASFSIVRYDRGAALAKGASRTPMLPMAGAGPGAGAGVSIALGGGKTNVGTMVQTEMTLKITRRGESTPVWEGRAVTYGVTGTRGDDPAFVSRKLAAALTRNFGAPSGLLVSVP